MAKVKVKLDQGPVTRWFSQWNHPKPKAEVNKKPSMTNPDMSMSIVEIIDKFASGRTLNLGKELYYDGMDHGTVIEDDFLLGKHWDSFDIIEKHEILAQGKTDFSRIKEGIKTAQKERADLLEAQRKQKNEDEKQILQFMKNQMDKDKIS